MVITLGEYGYLSESEKKKVTQIETLSSYEKLEIIVKINNEILKKGEQVLTPVLVGDTGVGKSSRVLQMFPDARILPLSMMLPEDVGGLLRITGTGEARYCCYVLPDWVKKDVIFFDEFDKASKSKQAVVLSVLTERRLSLIHI